MSRIVLSGSASPAAKARRATRWIAALAVSAAGAVGAFSASGTATAAPVKTAAVQTVPGESVWIQDSADRPFTSSTPPSSPDASIALYAAGDDSEAAQILFRSGSAHSGVSITTGALTGPGGPRSRRRTSPHGTSTTTRTSTRSPAPSSRTRRTAARLTTTR